MNGSQTLSRVSGDLRPLGLANCKKSRSLQAFRTWSLEDSIAIQSREDRRGCRVACVGFLFIVDFHDFGYRKFDHGNDGQRARASLSAANADSALRISCFTPSVSCVLLPPLRLITRYGAALQVLCACLVARKTSPQALALLLNEIVTKDSKAAI